MSKVRNGVTFLTACSELGGVTGAADEQETGSLNGCIESRKETATRRSPQEGVIGVRQHLPWHYTTYVRNIALQNYYRQLFSSPGKGARADISKNLLIALASALFSV
jgi:hypothetical protein